MDSVEQRRASKRTRTLLEGRVVFNNRFSLIECAVQDISETGARIMFAHPVQIPSEFELEIPKKNLSRHARLVWSNGKAHGIMFIERAGEQVGTENEADQPAPVGESEPRPAAGNPSDLRAVLDETRGRIALLLGIEIDAVRLKLEIDY